jgi:hypothetical protein
MSSVYPTTMCDFRLEAPIPYPPPVIKTILCYEINLQDVSCLKHFLEEKSVKVE